VKLDLADAGARRAFLGSVPAKVRRRTGMDKHLRNAPFRFEPAEPLGR